MAAKNTANLLRRMTLSIKEKLMVEEVKQLERTKDEKSHASES